MKHILTGLFLLLTSSAFASYLGFGEGGDVIKPGSFDLGAAPQLITSDGGGANIGAFLDVGWTDESSSRFSFGVGKVDFYLGGSYKYVPYPDSGKQPAVGVRGSFWIARWDSVSTETFQISPLVSKRLDDHSHGEWIPYVGIPINVTFANSTSVTGYQFLAGTEFTHPDVPDYKFAAEIALNLNNSITQISAFVSIPLDSVKGLKKRK